VAAYGLRIEVKPNKTIKNKMTDNVNVNAILAERGKTHGKFEDHAKISQDLKTILHYSDNEKWELLSNDQKEALDMIAHKIARILNGNADYVDHWADIAGYATLVANRLTSENS
jgi:hypothetical protein